MAIKVAIPADKNVVTAKGAYQWDYGQVLEIESPELGSEIVEVHFACQNMSEAIVCSCSFSNGFGTVTIPDACLEQASTLTAWIYRIAGTTGCTWKTISIPITARTRPSKSREVPREFHDKYTELITEINEAVDALESGDITVEQAKKATNADHAASAGTSATANYAVSAGSANRATSADSANSAWNANVATTAFTLARQLEVEHSVNDGASDWALGENERGVFVVFVRGTPDRLCSIVVSTLATNTTPVMGTNATYTHENVSYTVSAKMQYSSSVKSYTILPLVNGVVGGSIEGVFKIANINFGG